MQKVLLSFLIGCMGFISAHASSTDYSEEKTTTILEGNVVNDSPNLMIPAACHFYYDPATSELYVESHVHLDNPVIILENLTIGMHRVFQFYNTPGIQVIPFLEWPGIWRLSVVDCNQVFFSWDFTINNGKTTYVYHRKHGVIE